MDAEALLTQYREDTHRDQAPPLLRAFLLELEAVGVAVEATRLTRDNDSSTEQFTLSTACGLCVIRIEWHREPPGLWTPIVNALLYDWRSVSGVQLAYLGDPDGETKWTLAVGSPQLSMASGDFSDRAGGKTRALAAAILRHLATL